MKKIKTFIQILTLSFSAVIFSGCSLSAYLKNAVLGNIPVVKNFVQKEYATYTSITGIKDEMKLVTAKQQIDFINIMDGKDGRYLEVSTFEVKAGIDCAKIVKNQDSEGNVTFEYPPVEIFSSNKIHSVVPRKEADENAAQFYENSIKPVNIAYEQKSVDYAVELDILQNAKTGAERTLKNLVNAKVDLDVKEYKKSYEIKYLPFTLDIEKEYFDKKKMKVVPVKDDKFYRDSFILEGMGNDRWSIRIGDSGRTFMGTFEEFYQNVFTTNSNETNVLKDRVEIYRYFDPMFPKECEVLGYASDNYRTMFVLNNGHIYYVDAVVDSEQTLINDLSPTMVYLASSLRKITDYKVDKLDEYQNYISSFFDVQEAIRNNSPRNTINTATERLLKSNVIKDENTADSLDELYIEAVAGVKCIGRNVYDNTIVKTNDSTFDDLTDLINNLYVNKDKYTTDEEREKAIRITDALDLRIYHEKNKKSANTQYLETWFLQNNQRFNLSTEARKRYEDDIKSGETYIASRPMIAVLNDTERNEYFYSLFRNHLAMSHFFYDTAELIDDQLKKSVRGSNMFVYYNIPEFKELSDGDVYEQMKKQNKDKEINNAFIFVFSQREWDWGNFGADDDLHALVLDESTLRFFPNVGSFNVLESVVNKGKDIIQKILPDGLRTKDDRPTYFYYGDWKSLRITPENVSIAGHNFATKRVTKKGKAEYRNTNDYAEKSVIASVIDDIQHAYSNEDADYYFNVLCDNLDNQIQKYVYEKIFRPSPRMILDLREDAKMRYNN